MMLVLVVTLFVSGFLVPSGIALMIGGWVVLRVWRADQARRRYPLHYDLDGPTSRQFSVRIAALQALGRSERLWDAGDSVWADQRHHDEALALNGPSNVRIGPVELRALKTNVPTIGISTPAQVVLFLPDQILVCQSGRYASVAYAGLVVDCGSHEVTSRADPPADATVLGTAWVHSRHEGGADGRRGHTPRQQVVQYAQLSFRASEGLALAIDVSHEVLAYACAEAFRRDVPTGRATSAGAGTGQAGARGGGRRERPGSGPGRGGPRAGSRGRTRPPGATQLAAAHRLAAACAVLNVVPGASPDEIRTAYRRLARQYHPDTVAGQAPECVAVAERRMREINAAYELLSRPKAG
jgi:hypothetical protein